MIVEAVDLQNWGLQKKNGGVCSGKKSCFESARELWREAG
jgi:hypothetical protein